MKKRSFILAALILMLGLVLAACGSNNNKDNADNNAANNTNKDKTDFSAALVTDVGGIDDKSFNQSAWEGLQAWGKDHNLTKSHGFDYAQSEKKADYIPNLTRLVRQDYNLIFGIGFNLKDGIKKIAQQYPDNKFAIVDDVVDQPNVASITFKEADGSFLVGVAAAMKTKSNKVGFIGGVDSPLINKFESGFRAGVKSVNPDIDVKVDYAGSFAAADKGKLIATNMYNSGIDVIYHSSGATGNGVFSQAKNIKKNNPDKNIWVIGVDRDQYEEGQIGDDNVTLTSMVKRVDVAVEDLANKAMKDEFPGGKNIQYGFNENGIAIAKTNKKGFTDDIAKAVQDWKTKIMDGDIDVPKTRDEADKFIKAL